MQLVVVESPAKAKTIGSYLGPGYEVVASYGHVRDLAEKDGSVDPDRDFAMRWEVADSRSRQQVDLIAKAARRAERVLLATDPDREGEAISWHIAELLQDRGAVPPGGLARITFNAVTREAVEAALAAPRKIDLDLVDAYRARRALDYLVGFTLSPVLWRKLPGARSAGRVQSVALRLVVEREREIEAFRPTEYWSVTARFDGFDARLVLMDGRRLGKLDLGTEAEAEAARARVAAARFRVAKVDVKPVARHPAPPFTTSTLQQEAARRLGLSAAETMRLAQRLYEAGRITYMRTDGVEMAPEAIQAVRAHIAAAFPPAFLPHTPRIYRAKARNAQEAHEAIRPTDVGARPDPNASDPLERLYALVWARAVASQMASARLERTTVELVSDDGALGLRASGTVVVFPGFLALLEDAAEHDDEEATRLPPLKPGYEPQCQEVVKNRHQTEPPPRYSEASLVARLEELGIGRPSTYATIIEVLKERGYVRLERRRFVPEEKGILVTAFLERFFPRYVAYDFTAALEEDLDRISAGEADWIAVLRAFWADFRPLADEVLGTSRSTVEAELDSFLAPHLFPDRGDGTDPRRCPVCGDGRLRLKVGRNGPFVGCSRYPECRYTRGIDGQGTSEGPRTLGVDPETGREVVVRSGRFGPYLECGDRRASVPPELLERLDLELALGLLALPRTLGPHPETGEPVLAGIGPRGPYVRSGQRYARLGSVAEALEIGMNRAVALLAAPAPARRRTAPAAEPLAVLGAHPDTGAEVRLMPGRYGPYVTDGAVNASLPKGADPASVTLDQALAWLQAKAAAGGGRRPAGRASRARRMTARTRA
ncbi:MAG: type I DNA topoisomerase [Thermaurantiacus sp.]|uniref:type I DNA topoisomerase n=1 Tax=Thermaurantiacus sp. TaxID=2820283 RepID=UPI00298EFB9E|nr:type I DNA topoisomerase [Thermaurantiacus sp.]MDW8414376.1 type I DNA topoisomerase [Thermaurantiacus sp.]